MTYKSVKQLKKLSDKQFFEDIKKYIKSSYNFYESRAPELRVLANRLHEEYKLKEFYDIFDKFWNSGNPREISLAVYTLQLYKEEFDNNTWKFIKKRIKNTKSWDKLDSISLNIVGEILLKNPLFENEIIKFSKSKDIWFKRMAIISTIPLIKKKDFRLSMKIIEEHLYDKEEHIQKAIGWVLREIGEQKPEFLKRFMLKNIDMPLTVFFHATESMGELRRLRELKPINNGFEKLFFWKE